MLRPSQIILTVSPTKIINKVFHFSMIKNYLNFRMGLE